MSGSLSEEDTRDLLERARAVAAAARAQRPGERAVRQPLHTVYVPAHVFEVGTARAFGDEAIRLLETHAPVPNAFAVAFDLPASIAENVRKRVLAKLRAEPVEDVRIDFEDGYGVRSDEDEDRDAERTARAVADARAAGVAPPFFGLRVKSFADGAEGRSVRTLDRFLTALVASSDGLPDGFVVMFPKVVAFEHVELFARVLERLERTLGLDEGLLRFEVQVETPQSVVDPNGFIAAPRILEASGGRLSGMHFGVFDYTASLGLMPWEQRLDHPANDFARQTLQVAIAGSGVLVSDGSTNVVPAGERTEEVLAAWRVHADHVRHSLIAGFYQGWDLHPAHLVSRYAAVFGWLLPHLDDAAARVRAWREQARSGGVLDEPATVKSLLRYLRFAVTSGAVDEADVLERAGITHDELVGNG